MRAIFLPVLYYFFLLLPLTAIYAQGNAGFNDKPKLIVGIVVDQMRYDFLSRYYSKFGEGGFKRLINQGFIARNTHYNYVPTETAPGHASVYTGTTPAFHGIVGNDWFENGNTMYCVSDTSVKTLGVTSGNGEMSPKNLRAATITDQLKLHTNFKSKVIGISIKDRGAILPAGHLANAAYWYDTNSGKFISSTYYFNALPAWVDKFNQKKPADKYAGMTWQTLQPIEQYSESIADDNAYERLLPGRNKSVFPYNLKEVGEKIKSSQLKTSIYNVLTVTPFGNSLVKEMALAALMEEKLGKGSSTDFLAISFSSTDIAGHSFGPRSIEVEDLYLRLDKDLEELLENLDKEIGEDNYLLFLTADHGVGDMPQFLKDNKMQGGLIDVKSCRADLEKQLISRFGEGAWIEDMDDKQIYLNHRLITEKKLDLEEVQESAATFVSNCQGMKEAFTASELKEENFIQKPAIFIQKTYYPGRSGDVTMLHHPGWLLNFWDKGTSHGTHYNYDTHVPLLFYGWNIPKGKNTVRRVEITDIVPTLSLLMNIQLPDASTGQPIVELFEK